jgi:hypothetical protein
MLLGLVAWLGLAVMPMHGFLKLKRTAIVAILLTLPAVVSAAPIAPAPAPRPELAPGYQLAQDYREGRYYYYGPGEGPWRPCPYRYFYACWVDPYGARHCACRPDFRIFR